MGYKLLHIEEGKAWKCLIHPTKLHVVSSATALSWPPLTPGSQPLPMFISHHSGGKGQSCGLRDCIQKSCFPQTAFNANFSTFSCLPQGVHFFFLFFFLVCATRHVGLVSNPCPLHLKHRLSTTGLPGTSSRCSFLTPSFLVPHPHFLSR